MRTGKVVAAAATVLAVLTFASTARAQDAYPNKTITMIVPFAAGGSTDVIARLVAEGLRGVLGQPRDHVGRTARRERHDHGDGLVWIGVLRAGG